MSRFAWSDLWLCRPSGCPEPLERPRLKRVRRNRSSRPAGPASWSLLRTVVDLPGEPELGAGMIRFRGPLSSPGTVGRLAFFLRPAPGSDLDIVDLRQSPAAANSFDLDEHDQLLNLRLTGPSSVDRDAPRRPQGGVMASGREPFGRSPSDPSFAAGPLVPPARRERGGRPHGRERPPRLAAPAGERSWRPWTRPA